MLGPFLSRRLLLLAVLLLAVTAPRAHAHGGNFRVDNPSPRAPGGQPPAPVVPIPTPGGATPGEGPGLSSLAGRGPGGRLTGPRLALFEWPVWWALNHDTLLPPRQPQQSLRVGPVTPSATGRALPPDFVARLRWRRRRDESARRIAVPFLVELLEAEDGRDDVLVGAALIALARSATDATAVPYLRRYAFDRRAAPEVRECAVIGMGLARRTRSGERLSVTRLQHLRHDLQRLFDDERCSTQLRAFALYSLALLADQPYGDAPMERYGRGVTRWIERRLPLSYANDELSTALVVALGHQPPRGVSSETLANLKDLALRRFAYRRKWSRVAAAQAVEALARLRAPDAVRVASLMLRSRRPSEMVQSAACLALAQRAADLPSEERVAIARTLQKGMQRLDRHRVHGVGLLALGAILDAEIGDGSDAVLTESRVASYLRRELRRGSTRDRPFAALALGLAVRRARPTSRPILAFAVETRRALARGLETARGSDEVLAAYAAGVGLARAVEARPTLLAILADANRHHVLRGHCAIALAELGHRDREVATALLDAARERMHPYVHREAVRALAILGVAGSANDLLAQFEGRKNRGALVAVASSLGRLGDPDAADRMVRMARDPQACSAVRVASVVGLGLLFDREERPSRTRLSEDAAYTALTGTLATFFDVR